MDRTLISFFDEDVVTQIDTSEDDRMKYLEAHPLVRAIYGEQCTRADTAAAYALRDALLSPNTTTGELRTHLVNMIDCEPIHSDSLQYKKLFLYLCWEHRDSDSMKDIHDMTVRNLQKEYSAGVEACKVLSDLPETASPQELYGALPMEELTALGW